MQSTQSRGSKAHTNKKKGNRTTIIFTFVAINCVYISQSLAVQSDLAHTHSTDAARTVVIAGKTSTAHESTHKIHCTQSMGLLTNSTPCEFQYILSNFDGEQKRISEL